MASSDLVATWAVVLSDKVHKVEFEHGTTTGKRVIRVDGKEVMRRDWMFKLVGTEHFNVGTAKCCITIDAVEGFMYNYTLEVNGKDLEKFTQNQSKIMKTWLCHVAGLPFRIVLEKDTLDVWVNGRRVQTTGEFVDDGTETHFAIGDGTPAFIKAVSSGKRRTGIVHSLFINNVEVPESAE
jgi:hypothetical protein